MVRKASPPWVNSAHSLSDEDDAKSPDAPNAPHQNCQWLMRTLTNMAVNYEAHELIALHLIPKNEK